jgi:hypothetical protein
VISKSADPKLKKPKLELVILTDVCKGRQQNRTCATY